MKKKIRAILQNEVFQLLMVGVFAYTCFVAVILATIQIPPDALLDSSLKEVIRVFEG